MTIPVSLPLADTSVLILRAELAELARRAPERRRRRLVDLIDHALNLCELENLAGHGGQAPPPTSAVLVEWLQLEAGGPTSLMATSQQALDELYRLQERYLATVQYPGETDAALASPAGLAGVER